MRGGRNPIIVPDGDVFGPQKIFSLNLRVINVHTGHHIHTPVAPHRQSHQSLGSQSGGHLSKDAEPSGVLVDFLHCFPHFLRQVGQGFVSDSDHAHLGSQDSPEKVSFGSLSGSGHNFFIGQDFVDFSQVSHEVGSMDWGRVGCGPELWGEVFGPEFLEPGINTFHSPSEVEVVEEEPAVFPGESNHEWSWPGLLVVDEGSGFEVLEDLESELFDEPLQIHRIPPVVFEVFHCWQQVLGGDGPGAKQVSASINLFGIEKFKILWVHLYNIYNVFMRQTCWRGHSGRVNLHLRQLQIR